MASPRVVFPARELSDAITATEVALLQSRRDILETIGVQLLSYAKLDYVTKSRGGTGTDGIKWAPIKVGTILARLRKAGHIKSRPVAGTNRQTSVVAKTVKANEALFKQLARAGVKFRDKKGKVVKGNSPRAKAGNTVGVTKAVRSKSVTLSPGSYQIGVDTGLQLNSASPGYKGNDGKGGNVFQQDDVSVTVGFGRSYSDYFDKHRKLFPDTLPDPWREGLEEIAAREGGKIVEDTLGNKGVS